MGNNQQTVNSTYDDPRSDLALSAPVRRGLLQYVSIYIPPLQPSGSQHSFQIPMTSSQSQLLKSFDPFATHPFTNGSGLQPQPPKPSQYPIPIPSPRRPSAFLPTYSQYYGNSTQSPSSSTSSESSMPSKSPPFPIHAPQPRQGPLVPNPSTSPASPPQPIFVPFRKDTSSPELVLKKKAATTKNRGTQTPSTSQKS